MGETALIWEIVQFKKGLFLYWPLSGEHGDTLLMAGEFGASFLRKLLKSFATINLPSSKKKICSFWLPFSFFMINKSWPFNTKIKSAWSLLYRGSF